MTAERGPVDHLPPAAKFVLHILNQADEPLTRHELERQCGLPERTTNYALQRLRTANLVERTDSDIPQKKPRYGVASQVLRARKGDEDDTPTG